MRRIATILALLPLAAVRPALAETAFNGHVYAVVPVSGGIGWTQAKLAARQRGCGWHLATLTSAAEDKFLARLVAAAGAQVMVGRYGPWLGGYQHNSKAEPKGGWAWVTGEAFTYVHWAASEPNNRTAGDPQFEPGIKAKQSEEVLHYLAGGTWDDANVTAQAKGYVAERDSVQPQTCR